MKVRKSLEKSTLILGVEIQDMGVVLSMFFGINILIGVLRFFLPISSWWNLIALVFIFAYGALVRYGKKQMHPSYTISLLSFHFFQPKQIGMKPFSFAKKSYDNDTSDHND